MKLILGISGRKCSGKDSACRFIHGIRMVELGLIDWFRIDDDGKLIVPSADQDGNIVDGEFDIDNPSPAFIQYMYENIWGYCKKFSMADELKRLAMNAFGIPFEGVNGTNEQKSELSPYKWEDMPVPPSYRFGAKIKKEWADKKGQMTNREFVQYFGTEVMRAINPNAHVNLIQKSIWAYGSELSIIPDVRFKEEADNIRRWGGKVVRLTRKIDDDGHSSETELDDYPNFDLVIDNTGLTIGEKNKLLYEYLVSIGWMSAMEINQ